MTVTPGGLPSSRSCPPRSAAMLLPARTAARHALEAAS